MSAVPLPALSSDSLALLVFGPGTGELVMVRAPPGEWIVVDGCSADRVAYAQAALDFYEAVPRIIVLTHPHSDHAAGVADLVERFTPEDAPKVWPLLGMVQPPDTEGAGDTHDPQGALRGGLAERAVAAIRSRWELHADCQWTMRIGDQRSLGQATLTVLSPEASVQERVGAAYRSGRRVQWNDVSSALLLEWKGLRLVLGSDLEKRGWRAALRRWSNLAIHRALNVPHHGSRGALVAGLLSAPSRAAEPVWVATPFASRNLPRFDTGPHGGIAFLHRYQSPVRLTSLPRRYDDQGGPPGHEMTRSRLSRIARTEARDPARPGFPDCFVVIQLDRSGVPAITHGACSVVVTGPRTRSRASTRPGRTAKKRRSR